MYNLHTGKFHFQRNVRGHLSSDFQVTWANRANSTDRRRGATSTATVNTGGSTASTVLMTRYTEMTQGTRRTQRTSADRLKKRCISSVWNIELILKSGNWKIHTQKSLTKLWCRWYCIYWLGSIQLRVTCWKSHI